MLQLLHIRRQMLNQCKIYLVHFLNATRCVENMSESFPDAAFIRLMRMSLDNATTIDEGAPNFLLYVDRMRARARRRMQWCDRILRELDIGAAPANLAAELNETIPEEMAEMEMAMEIVVEREENIRNILNSRHRNVALTARIEKTMEGVAIVFERTNERVFLKRNSFHGRR